MALTPFTLYKYGFCYQGFKAFKPFCIHIYIECLSSIDLLYSVQYFILVSKCNIVKVEELYPRSDPGGGHSGLSL